MIARPGSKVSLGAPAEVELGQRYAVLGVNGCHERDQLACSDLERLGVRDLRAEVAVQAGELQFRLGQDLPHGVGGRAGTEREAELLVLDAVATAWWVCASTPGATRTSTR
jgi:hypothetical protein